MYNFYTWLTVNLYIYEYNSVVLLKVLRISTIDLHTQYMIKDRKNERFSSQVRLYERPYEL